MAAWIALACPRCNGALVPVEHLFGYFCQTCGWSLPMVQSIAAERARVVPVEGLLVGAFDHYLRRERDGCAPAGRSDRAPERWLPSEGVQSSSDTVMVE